MDVDTAGGMLGLVEQWQSDVGQVRDVDGDAVTHGFEVGGLDEPLGDLRSEPAGAGTRDEDV
jgi:hypothetical protein